MVDGPPSGFFVLFALVAGLIVCGWVYSIYAVARRRSALRAAGLDPITADIQLAQRFAGSELLAPQQSIEERLRELDDLHQRGLITDDERAAARAKALAPH